MPEKSFRCIRAIWLSLCNFSLNRIGAPSLHRIAACLLIVTVALSVSLSAQQTGTYRQMSQAMQLPASGRETQTSGTVSSQQTTSPGTSTSVLQPSVTVTGSYQGSVPGSLIPAGPVRLSLPDAVKRGLQTNLGIVTSGVSSSIVRAQRAQALSQLFPQITASIGATETQINLAAYGLNTLGAALGGALPSIVGPFQYVQAQGNLNWNALSMANVRNYQAANAVDHASRLSERDTRELVVLAVGGTYLQVLSASARIDSQRVQVKYAQATYDRANTQLSAGTNTRVDLTRSLVQLQSEQERLLALEGDYQQQKIAFARLIGLPQDAEVIFPEHLGLQTFSPSKRRMPCTQRSSTDGISNLPRLKCARLNRPSPPLAARGFLRYRSMVTMAPWDPDPRIPTESSSRQER